MFITVWVVEFNIHILIEATAVQTPTGSGIHFQDGLCLQ